MKKFLLFFLACSYGLTTLAQFSSSPSTPLAVSAAANSQASVIAIKDTFTATKGFFVFWLDQRSGSKKDVYGQRLDPSGNIMWEANGRLIATATLDISAHTAIAWQDGILLTYVIGNDSVMTMYLDENGANQWSAPSLVAKKDPSQSVIYVSAGGCLTNIPTSTGATVTYYPTFTGGSAAIAFNKIDFSGNVLLGNNANAFALSGYDYRSVGDGADGFYALSKGNGIGSSITIDRINSAGARMWASGREITGGSTNGFAGDINMSVDNNHDLYVSWDANNNNVQTTKVLADGSFGWAATRVGLASSSPLNAGRSFSRLHNDSLYVTWIETANSATNTMIQKLGPDGGLSLPAGGVSAGLANGYYGYPELAFSNNAVITSFSMNTNNTVGLAAYGLNTDNTPTWGGQKIFSNTYLYWNSYQDLVILDDPNGCNVIFWAGFNGNVYGANLCQISTILPVKAGTVKAERFGNINRISWEGFDQSAGDVYEVEKSTDGSNFTSLGKVNSGDVSGIYSFADEHPNEGVNYYRLKFISASGNVTYSNIVRVNFEGKILQMEIRPNPVRQWLYVQISNTREENGTITIFDFTGKTLKSQRTASSGAVNAVDLSSFAPGTYILKYTAGNNILFKKFQKH